MLRLRALLHARRWLALAIVVVALAVRIVVPAGLMPGVGGAGLTICTGHGAVVEHAGGRPEPGKAETPCAFTGLLAAAVDGPALPVLPSTPLPVLVVAIVGGVALIVRTVRLRPPLRGPPGTFAA